LAGARIPLGERERADVASTRRSGFVSPAASNRLSNTEFLELIVHDELNVRQQHRLARRTQADRTLRKYLKPELVIIAAVPDRPRHRTVGVRGDEYCPDVQRLS